MERQFGRGLIVHDLDEASNIQMQETGVVAWFFVEISARF